VSLRITKSKGEPIHLVPEGTPGATIVGVKRVNELGFYSLNLTALANKINMTMPKTLAIVRHLKLQDDPEYFNEVVYLVVNGSFSAYVLLTRGFFWPVFPIIFWGGGLVIHCIAAFGERRRISRQVEVLKKPKA
jgi:hypothetical protein